MQGYIANITKSFVDWSEKESIVLFFAGCDFRCPYCFVSNILDFKEEYLKELREVKQLIKELALSSDTIYFTGGEPCLQKPVLVELSKFSKQLGLKTGLQTNGSNPKVIKSLLQMNLLDYISVDVKSPFDSEVFEKSTKSKTFFKPTEDIISSIKETLNILKQNKEIVIDIRTAIVPSVMFNKEYLLRIASEVKSINCRWILQQYQPSLGKLVNKNLAGINPPTYSFLQNLQSACLKVYPTLNIEIKMDGFNVI